jgi:hypothetical protein
MTFPEGTQLPGWQGGDGNAAYIDKTLRYMPVETTLDETVSGRILFQIWKRAAFASLLAGLFTLFITVLSSGSSSRSRSGDIPDFTAAVVVMFIVFVVVFLAIRLPEPIGEWRVLLTDRADTADSVYSQISGTLSRRGMPIRVYFRRIHNGFGRGANNRLVLREGNYTAYVSVFAYGTSLYLGWTMWRSRYSIVLLLQFVMDSLDGFLNRNDPERKMMQTERPRAMREAVHAVCREGLVVAIEARAVPPEFGFPQGMPPVDGSNIPPAPGFPGTNTFPQQQQYPPPPVSGPFPQVNPDGRHRQESEWPYPGPARQ